MLKFGKGNAKLSKTIATFSIPAGRTCPGAMDCRSMAVEKDGKLTIKDGKSTVFRCFAASQEVIYPSTYRARQHNLRALRACKTKGQMAKLIMASLPKTEYVRTHVSGDFFSQMYFDAWMLVARSLPDVLFYAYTKSLHLWTKRVGEIPTNFVLTASVGGRHDALISQHGLRSARVVYSEEEAATLGLPIDKDDSHAMKNGGDFALLIHGNQPKGSRARKALTVLRKAGKGGYSK